ncbi:MAG: hypothetical protein R3B68_08965 [Phycisphaerales bacterium]
MASPAPTFRLRNLPLLTRLGLTCLIITLLGGMFASLVFLYDHYRNRDEEPELTLLDIEGAYRGATVPAPILTALESNHPADIEGAPPVPDADRQMLLDWLRGPRIPENYENFDLGPPADLIAIHCASCHTRAAAADPDSGITRSLEFWEDVRPLALSRDMQPTPQRVLVISTHAHATTLALVGAFAAACLTFSFWPRWLVGLLVAGMGLGLLLDIGAWWAIRLDASWWLGKPGRNWVYAIVAGGALFNAGVWLAMSMTLVELWRPRFGKKPESSGESG